MRAISKKRFESEFRAVAYVGNKWAVINMITYDFVKKGISKSAAYKLVKELNN